MLAQQLRCAWRHLALRRSSRPPLCARQRSCSAASASGDSVYDHPRLYDVAFGLRDFESETTFLVDAARTHGGCAAPSTWLELACGPGRHTRLAADLGLRAVGLDVSDAMLSYAKEQADQEGAGAGAGCRPPVFARGNMTAPSAAPEVAAAAPYDVICCLLGSLTHLLTLRECLACFSGAAALLSRPHGVFCVEVVHPRHLFDGSVTRAVRKSRQRADDDADADEDGRDDDWEVPTWDAHAPDVGMRVQWGAPGDAFDSLSQVLQRTVSIEANHQDDAGGAPEARLLRSVVPTRLFTAAELELLATAAGLRIAAAYGELDADVDAHDERAERLVLVMTHA